MRRQPRKRTGFAIPALFLLIGCGADSPPAPPPPPPSDWEERVDFSCADGQTFTVYFAAGRQQVRLLYHGVELILERAPGDTTELFTADAIYFGSTRNADGSREGFVAEGETIVRENCRSTQVNEEVRRAGRNNE